MEVVRGAYAHRVYTLKLQHLFVVRVDTRHSELRRHSACALFVDVAYSKYPCLRAFAVALNVEMADADADDADVHLFRLTVWISCQF